MVLKEIIETIPTFRTEERKLLYKELHSGGFRVREEIFREVFKEYL